MLTLVAADDFYRSPVDPRGIGDCAPNAAPDFKIVGCVSDHGQAKSKLMLRHRRPSGVRGESCLERLGDPGADDCCFDWIDGDHDCAKSPPELVSYC